MALDVVGSGKDKIVGEILWGVTARFRRLGRDLCACPEDQLTRHRPYPTERRQHHSDPSCRRIVNVWMAECGVERGVDGAIDKCGAIVRTVS